MKINITLEELTVSVAVTPTKKTGYVIAYEKNDGETLTYNEVHCDDVTLAEKLLPLRDEAGIYALCLYEYQNEKLVLNHRFI